MWVFPGLSCGSEGSKPLRRHLLPPRQVSGKQSGQNSSWRPKGDVGLPSSDLACCATRPAPMFGVFL